MRIRGSDGTRALWSATAIGLILAVFFFLRLPLLTTEGAQRGWNGDGGVFGLMAKKIHDGTGFDVFFWGQNYMGPLTPALAAGIRRAILDPAGVKEAGGPIALRLASMAEIAFGICLYILALTRLFGRTIGAATGLWMAIGPPFFIRLSVVYRLGPEMAFALGSIVLFLAVGALTRPRPFLDRPGGRFTFGLLAGLGLWMNQTILFILLPVAALVLFRSQSLRARSWRRGALFLAPLLGGAALGYLPVFLGRLLGWYEPALGTVVPPWQSTGLPARFVRFLGADSWQFLGLDGILPRPLLAAVALAVLSFLLLRFWRHLELSLRTQAPAFDGLDLVGSIAGLGAAVGFLQNLNVSQERYLTPALPAAIAAALVSIAYLARVVARRVPVPVVAVVLIGFAASATVFLLRQARSVVDEILLEPDPRATLETIRDGGYTVCHAGYDTAYRLQFLSDERVRFIPFHSPDRNRKLSAELRALPGPQCLVMEDGAVRRWLPSDAAEEGGPARLRAEASKR